MRSSIPPFASSDSLHLQQSINTKKLEIKRENMYESKLSTKLEKLREDIEKQTDIIADSEKKLTRLELEKKQKQETELKYRDEREQTPFSYIWTGKLDIEDYILFVTFYEYHYVRIFLSHIYY
jgi:chromosome segregation ATPase